MAVKIGIFWHNISNEHNWKFKFLPPKPPEVILWQQFVKISDPLLSSVKLREKKEFLLEYFSLTKYKFCFANSVFLLPNGLFCPILPLIHRSYSFKGRIYIVSLKLSPKNKKSVSFHRKNEIQLTLTHLWRSKARTLIFVTVSQMSTL